MGWLNEKIGSTNGGWLSQTAQDVGTKANWLHENVLAPASHVSRTLGQLAPVAEEEPPMVDMRRPRKKSRRKY